MRRHELTGFERQMIEPLLPNRTPPALMRRRCHINLLRSTEADTIILWFLQQCRLAMLITTSSKCQMSQGLGILRLRRRT